MPQHIQIDDDANLAFWCAELSVSPAKLLNAVQTVGGSARFVAQYLQAAEARELAGSVACYVAPNYPFPAVVALSGGTKQALK